MKIKLKITEKEIEEIYFKNEDTLKSIFNLNFTYVKFHRRKKNVSFFVSTSIWGAISMCDIYCTPKIRQIIYVLLKEIKPNQKIW